MLDRALETHRALKAAHAEAHELVKQLEAEVRALRDPKELADVTFAMRRSAEFAKDMIRRMKNVEELSEKMACAIYLAEDKPGPIRTEYCCATPDVKMVSSLPSRKHDPAGYTQLMKFLGIDESLYTAPEGEKPAVETFYPGMVDLLTRLSAEGKPLPPGIDPSRVTAVYRLSPIQPRKELE